MATKAGDKLAQKRTIKGMCRERSEEHLSVDGKVMNGSRYKDQKSIEVIGAILSEIGFVIAHQKIAEKSKRILLLNS